MHLRRTASGVVALLPIAIGLVLGGCAGYTIEFGPPQASEPNNPTTAPVLISVRVVNQTGKPLDPEIYASFIADGADKIFEPGNKRTSYGFGGLGLLEANSQGAFAINCDQGVYIATKGGAFGDDLSQPIGRGQQYIFEEDKSVLCGDTLVFTFSASASTLITQVTIE